MSYHQSTAKKLGGLPDANEIIRPATNVEGDSDGLFHRRTSLCGNRGGVVGSVRTPVAERPQYPVVARVVRRPGVHLHGHILLDLQFGRAMDRRNRSRAIRPGTLTLPAPADNYTCSG